MHKDQLQIIFRMLRVLITLEFITATIIEQQKKMTDFIADASTFYIQTVFFF